VYENDVHRGFRARLPAVSKHPLAHLLSHIMRRRSANQTLRCVRWGGTLDDAVRHGAVARRASPGNVLERCARVASGHALFARALEAHVHLKCAAGPAGCPAVACSEREGSVQATACTEG